LTPVAPQERPTARVDFDDTPLRWFHGRLALASSGGVFSDGYGLGIIGIALSKAPAYLQLSPVWMGLLGGASLFGLFAGALLTGPAADRFGRRPIFAYNMAFLAGLTLLQYVADSPPQILALRLAIGFLLGTDYVVSKALLTEFTPRRLRGRIMGTLSIAWAGGYACAYFVGYALSDSGPNAWRWMLLTSALPCLLILPLRLPLPESPLWLANHGRDAEAAQVVRARLGAHVLPPRSTPAHPSSRGRWRQLLSRQWRRRTAVGCLFFTCQVIPYFALGTFITQVLAALNVKNGHAGGLVYNAALLGGAAAGLIVVDRLPRRSFLIGSFGLAAGAMSVLALWADMPTLLLGILFAIFASVLSAQSNLVYVYLPELFPTDLRASGIGVSIAASRVGSAVGTFLLPVVVAQYGVRTALGACVAILVVGAVACARWAPETRNLGLAAMDRSAAAAEVDEVR
jgi:MFS transporter, putative metabolite transport protein